MCVCVFVCVCIMFTVSPGNPNAAAYFSSALMNDDSASDNDDDEDEDHIDSEVYEDTSPNALSLLKPKYAIPLSSFLFFPFYFYFYFYYFFFYMCTSAATFFLFYCFLVSTLSHIIIYLFCLITFVFEEKRFDTAKLCPQTTCLH